MVTASQKISDSVLVRPAEDPAFFFKVYASTREEELALTGWTEAQKAAFLEMQFRAQDLDYRSRYPGAVFAIIEVCGKPAGRLYLHRRPKEIRVMDISLLPEFRGRGIGTSLLQQILDEATQARKSVSIHVEVFNPARRLYERLGFKKVGENGPYLLMERSPETKEAP